MQAFRRSVRTVGAVLIVVGFCFGALTACEAILGILQREWSEDVLLPDGKTVPVRRSIKLRQSNALGGGAYSAEVLEASLEIEGTSPHSPKWNVPLEAMVLYREDITAEWVLVAMTDSCDVLYDRGNPRYLFGPDKPRTKYFEFRLRGGKWREVALSKQSVGRPANLLQNYRGLNQSHVTVAIREGLDRGLDSTKEYGSIVEAPQHVCLMTTNAKWMWEAEDAALSALDRFDAPASERSRVMDFFAGTRIVYIRTDDDSWSIDADPKTVQWVRRQKPIAGGSGVSSDGQVIYDLGPYDNDAGLIRDSYTRRLRFAGLGKYAE